MTPAVHFRRSCYPRSMRAVTIAGVVTILGARGVSLERSSDHVRLSALAVYARAVQSQSTDMSVWSVTLQDEISSTAAASNGRCLVALVGSRVHVLDSMGRPLWDSSALHATHREDGPLAVSSSCEWVALSSRRQPTHVQIIERGQTGRVVALAERPDDDQTNASEPRSLAIAPDSGSMAVGTEADRLVLISREGNITRRIDTAGGDSPVDVEFLPDGKNLLLTGMVAGGVLTLDGQRRWPDRSGSIRADRSLRFFAAWFTRSHGPQDGDVSLLDQRGRVLWTRSVWSPSVDIAPDGAFVAVSAVPESAVQPSDIGPVPYESREEVSLIGRDGKDLARRTLRASVRFVTADSRCVVLEHRDGLAGLDLALNDRWTLPGSWHFFTRLGPNLLVRSDGRTLRAFRIPGCGA